jgi:hypothetical protein
MATEVLPFLCGLPLKATTFINPPHKFFLSL